jgi:predicted nuclease of predicted toxin-antitoxin system
LTALGAEAIHTLDFPTANRTTDEAIIALAKQESRVVITKDSDFVDSLLLRNEPERLLFITTGNISNDDLIRLIRGHWPQIISMLQQGSYVEMSRFAITLHF